MEFGTPFQLIDVLRQHDVPFVVIGGHAVNFHGYIRATEDTDIVFLRTPESERRLFDALCEVHAHWIGDEVDPKTGLEKSYPVSEAYVCGTRLMMLTTDHGYLDVFDFVPGLPNYPVSELLNTSVPSERGPFVSLSLLRKIKAAAGRPRDQLDLEQLPSDD